MPPRRLLKQVGLGASLLAGLYLIGANLALNSGAAERLLSRRPQRVRFTWARAWSLYPGHLAARGLKIEGRVRSRRWEIAADRVAARYELWPLARREFRAPRLVAHGASTRVWREVPPPGAPAAARPAAPRPRRRRWLFRFDDVAVDGLRTVEIQGFTAVCGGRAAGAFRFAPGHQVAVERSTLSCPAAELAAGGRTFARQVRLDATADLAAYSPRQHPGVRGFDFLSAQLHARGQAEPAGARNPLAMGILPAAGNLEADLELALGRLRPGSRIVLASADGAAALGLTVAGAPPATVLSARAPRFEIPGQAGQPAALTTGPISLAASTPETRLSHLLAVERHLRREQALPAAHGLTGELEAESVRVVGRGAAHWTGEADLVRGKVDLGGLFHRRLALDGMRARGVTVRWRRGTPPSGTAAAGRRWELAIRDAEIDELRELELAQVRLLGPARLEATATFHPEQGFELERARFDGPAVGIRDGEHEVARALELHAEAEMGPVRFGETTARQALRSTSGSLTVAGRVASLRFLARFLQRAPWLRIDGQGQLYGELRLRNGELEPGSEWRLEKATLRAKILDDLATGDATLQGGVHPGRRGPEATFDARLRRFKFAPDQPGNPAAYLRGDSLRIQLVSRDVDLAERVQDLSATVAMDNGQVPDLRVYNSYLPPAAGVAIQSGSGRLRLSWKLDLATQRGTGKIGLDSPRIGVRFQDVDLAGRLRLDASLAAPDLRRRRFDLTGSELRLDDVVFREIGSDGGGGAEGWWAHLRLPGGSFQWQRPLTLNSQVELEMKDSGFLLSLFTRKKQKLGWFAKVLDVENVVARGQVRLDPSGLQIDGLRAAGGPLDLRARLRLGKGNRRGDLYVSYGKLAAGVELRDGQRDMKLIRPLAWYESRR